MRPFSCIPALLAAATVGVAFPTAAQQHIPHPTGTLEQRAAIDRLDSLDGEWAGPAWSLTPGGGRVDMIQTERVGDLAGGSLKVVEGRGYTADGATAFNAFAVITFDQNTGKYQFSTFVDGVHYDFPLQVTEDGFVWERPAGPGGVVRFTSVVKDGKWHEIGEYIAEGRPPVKMIELNLTRVGDGAWPAAGAVDPSRGRPRP